MISANSDGLHAREHIAFGRDPATRPGTIAELTGLVEAPATNAAVLCQGTGVLAGRGYRLHATVARDAARDGSSAAIDPGVASPSRDLRVLGRAAGVPAAVRTRGVRHLPALGTVSAAVGVHLTKSGSPVARRPDDAGREKHAAPTSSYHGNRC